MSYRLRLWRTFLSLLRLSQFSRKNYAIKQHIFCYCIAAEKTEEKEKTQSDFAKRMHIQTGKHIHIHPHPCIPFHRQRILLGTRIQMIHRY